MKLVTLSVLTVMAVIHAGCVTEGEIRSQPASDAAQAEANLSLGAGDLQENRPDLAIDALLRAVEVEPRHANAHSVLAIAYDQTGETELAEDHHRRALVKTHRAAPVDGHLLPRLGVQPAGDAGVELSGHGGNMPSAGPRGNARRRRW